MISNFNGSQIDSKMFETYKTGKPIDKILSDDGGLMKGTVIVVMGSPGSGKTSIANDIIAEIKTRYKGLKVLFVSSEETEMDRAYNCRKSPKIKELPTLFLSSIEKKASVLANVLNEGWDIVVIDSFKDAQDKLQLDNSISQKEAETWLLNLMLTSSRAQNKAKKNTTFLCIQQVLKSGTFAGNNSLKHNTTAMMEVCFDQEDPSKRYIVFTKNRRAGSMVGKRVYYTFSEETQSIEYSEPVLPPTKQDKKKKAVETYSNGVFLTNTFDRYQNATLRRKFKQNR